MTIAVAGLFPVMAIVSLQPAVPAILAHFSTVPAATTVVPLMVVTAPSLMIALLSSPVGWFVDRYGRRAPMLAAMACYALFGMAPLVLDSLTAIFAARLALGIVEAVILTCTNVLLADYFDEDRRRTWLTLQAVFGPALGTATILSSGYLTMYRWNGAFVVYAVGVVLFVAALAFLYEPARCGQRMDETGGVEQAAPSRFPVRVAAIYVPVTVLLAIQYYLFMVYGGTAFAAAGLTDTGQLGIGAKIGVAGGNRL